MEEDLPGMQVIQYKRMKHEDAVVLKNTLKPSVYLGLLLEYLDEYNSTGMIIPESIKDKTSFVVRENIVSWFEHYFKKASNNIVKKSVHQMYCKTVGAIPPKEFTSLLRKNNISIGNGLLGNRLVYDGGEWYERNLNKKNVCIRQYSLK